MRRFLTRNIVAGLVLSCLVFSLGTLGFAASINYDGSPPQGDRCQPPGGRPDFAEHLEVSLTKLVSDGTITVEQKEALVKFFKEKEQERKAAQEKQHADRLHEIMTAGKLTPEQAQAVDDVLHPPMPPGGPQGTTPPEASIRMKLYNKTSLFLF